VQTGIGCSVLPVYLCSAAREGATLILLASASAGPENPPDLDLPKDALFHPRIAAPHRAVLSD
jgi:hypothetical protein